MSGERITVEKLTAEMHKLEPGSGWYEDAARRALELCGPTLAERELIEAALLSAERHPNVCGPEFKRLAAKVREERRKAAGPRFVEWEFGFRDTLNGINFTNHGSGFAFTHDQRQSLLAALNSAHERGEIP